MQDTVVEAVKSGAIRHFFLVAGCDGAKPGRNYYTEFVKQTPSDTVSSSPWHVENSVSMIWIWAEIGGSATTDGYGTV